MTVAGEVGLGFTDHRSPITVLYPHTPSPPYSHTVVIHVTVSPRHRVAASIGSLLCQLLPHLLRPIPPLTFLRAACCVLRSHNKPFAKVNPFRIANFLGRRLRTSAVHPEIAVGARVKISIAEGACVPEPHLFRKFHFGPTGGACHLHFLLFNSFRTSSALFTDFFTHSPSILPASSEAILSSSSPFSSLYRST